MTATIGVPQMPGGLPLAGHVRPLRRKPLEFLRTVRYYGDVVVIRVGGAPAYVVNSPGLVHEVLVTHQHQFQGGLAFEGLRDTLGNGIAVSDGYFHHRQRRLLEPAFHQLRVRHYAAGIAEIAHGRAAAWQAGDTVDLKKELLKITVEMAVRVLFSADAGPENIRDIQRSWPVLLEGMSRRSAPRFIERTPIPRNRRYADARDRLRAAVARIITHHRASGADHGDVLSAMLSAGDHPNGYMTDQQITDELMSLLGAGTLEPYALTCWMLYHLSTDREVDRRVQAEQTTTSGYLDRVASETLRMHPPVWLSTRRATGDVSLGEHVIPAGATVLFSPYAMHHDGGLFVYGQHFDPDRWLPDRAMSIPPHAYVPFGGGDRRCVGETIGRTQALLLTAAIANRWELRLQQAEQIHEVPGTVLTPNRLVANLQRRHWHNM